MKRQPTAVIIGAGVGGLATAAILAKAGYKVTVYEALDKPGGRAGLKEADGFRFDTGPSWYLMPEVFEQFFELFGKTPTDYYTLLKLKPAYRVFYDYRDSVTVRGDLGSDGAMFEAIEPGSGQALRNYLSDAAETYDLAKKYFLYNPFTRFSTLLQPEVMKRTPKLIRLLGQKMNSYVGSKFKALPLQQLLEYPAVFLGTSPFKAPAMYHLMSYLDFEQGVFYPKGGLYEIVKALQALAESEGVTIHCGQPVSGIMTTGGKATGIRLKDGSRVSSDVVVSNADLHFTETELLSESDRTYPDKYWKQKTAGPSALLMYLGVEGKLPQLTHHNLLFTEKWQENFDTIFRKKAWPQRPSLYVCKPSQTDDSVAPKGTENVFVLVPLPAGAFKDKATIETYADKCLERIEIDCDIPDLRERIIYKETYDANDFANQLHTWQGTALGLAHLLSQSAFFRPANKSKKLSNLYYVGGDVQPGIGLPMCLISAQLVYKRLTHDNSAGPLDHIETVGGN